jgi:serine protease AprX
MEKSVSRVHTDEFLHRERQEIEKLRAEMGNEVLNKMDRLLLRDLIYERKERALAETFQQEVKEPKHTVMINAHSGQAQSSVGRPGTVREKRKRVVQMQRAGLKVTGRIEADLKQLGAEVLDSFWLTHSVVAELERGPLETVVSRGDIRSAIAVKRHFISCLDVSRPLIQADQVANTLGFNGTGVTVAIIDTGVDITHPALAGVVIGQQDFTGLGVGDGFGHGTHCAGIVASQDKTFTGIAPGASLLDLRIMDNTGSSTAPIAVAGITAAVTAGVNVASNSWGFSHANGAWTDADGTCVLCTAADAAVAAGVVFAVAAGNSDNDTCSTYDSHIGCPGIARSVITVAASDDNDSMAGFSSLGPTPDNRPKPDITAPGVQIASCRAAGTNLGPTVDPAGNFINLDGTSMATPHVAGVAALMLDKTPALTPAQILGIMMATAVNIGATANEMGAGRVDALAAVNAS